MNLWHAIVYGLIQGTGEFLPISSSGHLAILPSLLKIEDPGVMFDLSMHVGTSLAAIIYFRHDLFGLFRELWEMMTRKKENTGYSGYYHSLLINLFIGSFFTFIFVIILQKFYPESERRSILMIGINQIVFGLIMWGSDWWAKKNEQTQTLKTSEISPLIALFTGITQSFAIFPGVARSGITLSVLRFGNVGRLEASRFSFLLSLPIILGGAALEIPHYLQGNNHPESIFLILIGAGLSFVFGLLSIHYFLKLIEKVGFFPFMIYRLLVGIGILLFIWR